MKGEDGMKVLIDMRHGLGDTVHALPMLHTLHKLHPDWCLAVMVRDEANKKLVELARIPVNRFIFFNMAQAGIKEMLQLIFELRHQHFDYAILSPITDRRKGRLLNWFSGAVNLIGEQYHDFIPGDWDNRVHLVDRNMLLLESLGIESSTKEGPVLYSESQDILAVKEMLGEYTRPIWVLNVGNASPSRYHGELIYTRGWGEKNIRCLAERVLQQMDVELCLLGGPDEQHYREVLVDLCTQPHVHEFIGRLSIGQSVALAQLAELVIGVDTGMQHIADAVGTYTVSIFGPTNPKTHGAYSSKAVFVQHLVECQYCYTREDYYTCKDRRCLQEITVDDVLETITSVTNGISKNYR